MRYVQTSTLSVRPISIFFSNSLHIKRFVSKFHQRVLFNSPRSIYQYSKMAPRLTGQNFKFFEFLLSRNSQKRLVYKENNTKYGSLSWKPRSHVRILIIPTWTISSTFCKMLSRNSLSTVVVFGEWPTSYCCLRWQKRKPLSLASFSLL